MLRGHYEVRGNTPMPFASAPQEPGTSMCQSGRVPMPVASAPQEPGARKYSLAIMFRGAVLGCLFLGSPGAGSEEIRLGHYEARGNTPMPLSLAPQEPGANMCQSEHSPMHFSQAPQQPEARRYSLAIMRCEAILLCLFPWRPRHRARVCVSGDVLRFLFPWLPRSRERGNTPWPF